MSVATFHPRMGDIAVRVENLGKVYQIGGKQERYKTLRDKINDMALGPVRALQALTRGQRTSRAATEDFWALKDVSFEVKRGEVVGIIGRNGAGKSTLLKVLSRITEPSTGRAEINGRVSSLLEVGTGFHPELTGRENIFLNGAILGMRKSDIDRKFDEIVEFAEVERFLDTPVKHFSSGMYMRLAFAVAAHLDPAVLVVDEVLAVGDAEFQRKCLGKMRKVAENEGRTVLFVSHNMDAVLRLCNKGILLENGELIDQGNTHTVVNKYLDSGSIQSDETIDLRLSSRSFSPRGRARFTHARLTSEHKNAPWKIPFGTSVSFSVDIDLLGQIEQIELAVALLSGRGFEIASNLSSHTLSKKNLTSGKYRFYVSYNDLRLVTGQYSFRLAIRSSSGLEDFIDNAFHIEILSSDESAHYRADAFEGVIIPDVAFDIVPVGN